MSASLSAQRRRRGIQPGINLVPMLDVILNLLFFFVIATQLRTNMAELRVHLPKAGNADQSAPQATPPTILLDAAGQMVYKGRVMVKEEIILELHHLAAQGQHRVVIRGDRDVNWGKVVELWDLCKGAGLSEVVSEIERTSAPASR